MNKNRLLRAVALLWVLVVLSAAALSGVTLAKYAAGASGSATGTIAKWSVSAGTVSAVQSKYANGSAYSVASPTITITNGGEVTTDFYIELKTSSTAYPASNPASTWITAANTDAFASLSYSGTGHVETSGNRVRLSPDGTGTVTISTKVTTAITSSDQSGAYRKYEVHVYAIQVD